MANQHDTHAARVGQAMLGLLLLALLPLTLRAEEVPVPASLQVKLLLKVLTFDRNFSQKMAPALRIGIVYDPRNPESHQAHLAITGILDQFANTTIKKIPIQYVRLAYRGEPTFSQLTQQHDVNVLYIMPGNADYLKKLLRVSHTHQITTVTGVPAYVEEGVAVGVDVKTTDRKPLILINLPASKSQGNAFDAKLLKLAKVLK